MLLDFGSGRFECTEPTSVRTVQDLREIWETQPLSDDCRIVYRTFGMPGDDRETPDLLYATTVIEPGDVHGEAFMTRGHFHLKPERGEWMLVLRGVGRLILRNRDGETWSQPIESGSTVLIDGSHAHRIANTGSGPLAFVVVWLADCGHDYETTCREGFGVRVRVRDGCQFLAPNRAKLHYTVR